MTIQAAASQVEYAGDGTTTAFAIPFPFDTAADIKVVLRDSDGTPIDLSTGFSITGGNGSTGTCTMDVAPAVDEALIIFDDPELTQPADYTANDSFPADMHEGALDRIERQVKRLHQRVNRSIRMRDGDGADGDDLLLPLESARAGLFLAFDANGNPVASSGTGGGDTALRTDLANGTPALVDSASVSHRRTDAEQSAGVTPVNYAYPPGDVRRYGAVLDGTTDDTAALIAATQATAGTGVPVVIPYGTMLVTPGTAQTGAASYNCACQMLSDTSYVGFNAATIKVADDYSTDASPKELAIFSTDEAIAHVSFTGITFDLNGANNLMSPSRPVTYNAFNHAAIMANGPDGYINNCSIYDCTFKNNAGVCFVVCQLVAAGTTPIVGKTWNIVNNLFLNGGTDSQDHTAVYALCENVVCDGNTFWQDDPPHTVGKTGGATGYEVHGSNQRVVNNYFYNYTVGMYVAPNFTSETINTIVANNNFYCSDYGVLIWRWFESGVVEYADLDDILIEGNTFYFGNYTYSGQPAYKAAVAFQGQIPSDQGSVNNVKISNNLAVNTGNTLLSHFVKWDSPTPQANQKCTNVSVTDNTVIGFTNGVQIITNSDNGQGLTTISRNEFINLTPDSLANLPTGIYVDATGDGCDFLVIEGNSFIDTRGGSASFARGVRFVNGTITNLYLGPQLYSGLTSSNYTESGVTITNWLGPARSGANTVTYSASMTPDWSAGTDQIITATNNSNFTINAPIRMQDGEHMTITIRNTSGGALGTATFDSAYGLAAWTQPANGFSRSITFRRSGSLYIEIGRTTADVPN